jgi:hypothetical protein
MNHSQQPFHRKIMKSPRKRMTLSMPFTHSNCFCLISVEYGFVCCASVSNTTCLFKPRCPPRDGVMGAVRKIMIASGGCEPTNVILTPQREESHGGFAHEIDLKG